MLVVMVMMAMTMVMMVIAVMMTKHGNENDFAVRMPVVVMADHFLVKVERLCAGREADGERQRGDRRKQGFPEHGCAPVGLLGLERSRPC